jgi:hypothetical protein
VVSQENVLNLVLGVVDLKIDDELARPRRGVNEVDGMSTLCQGEQVGEVLTVIAWQVNDLIESLTHILELAAGVEATRLAHLVTFDCAFLLSEIEKVCLELFHLAKVQVRGVFDQRIECVSCLALFRCWAPDCAFAEEEVKGFQLAAFGQNDDVAWVLIVATSDGGVLEMLGIDSCSVSTLTELFTNLSELWLAKRIQS